MQVLSKVHMMMMNGQNKWQSSFFFFAAIIAMFGIQIKESAKELRL